MRKNEYVKKILYYQEKLDLSINFSLDRCDVNKVLNQGCKWYPASRIFSGLTNKQLVAILKWYKRMHKELYKPFMDIWRCRQPEAWVSILLFEQCEDQPDVIELRRVMRLVKKTVRSRKNKPEILFAKKVDDNKSDTSSDNGTGS